MGRREAEAVAETLDRAGVPDNGVLFIHSAFGRLAAQGLRPEPFIEALIDYMARGTLVMPAMSWRVVTATTPVFDELTTISHVGVLPELFRTRYATHRSLHPTHSVAAHGRLAAHLTSTHHCAGTPCAMTSPYGKARAEDAHVVLLGIGLERCTAIHHAEEISAPDIYLVPPEDAVNFELRSREGAVYLMRLRGHTKLNRNFPQFAAPLTEQRLMRQGDLMGTPWQAVSQRDLLDEVLAALDRDPHAIIAPPGAPAIP
jgi:aminoglycoside 3-N-acetyltransferase